MSATYIDEFRIRVGFLTINTLTGDVFASGEYVDHLTPRDLALLVFLSHRACGAPCTYDEINAHVWPAKETPKSKFTQSGLTKTISKVRRILRNAGLLTGQNPPTIEHGDGAVYLSIPKVALSTPEPSPLNVAAMGSWLTVASDLETSWRTLPADEMVGRIEKHLRRQTSGAAIWWCEHYLMRLQAERPDELTGMSGRRVMHRLSNLFEARVDSERRERALALLHDLWIAIPSGQFFMGAPDDDGLAMPDERPRHHARIGKGLSMLAHPVTNRVYWLFNPRHAIHQNPKIPVTEVTWWDAAMFARWLGGEHIRLPTETEWERVAWANPEEQQSMQKEIVCSGGGQFGPQVFASSSDRDNHLGFADMLGNVWEWCDDHAYRTYDDVFQWVETRGFRHPVAQSIPRYAWAIPRVFRGGSWCSIRERCRPSIRSAGFPGTSAVDVGFRLVKVE